MNVLTFDICLIEPVLVMDVGGGDPNSANTLDFIPGSAIRGALVERYPKKEQVDLSRDDETSREFHRLFLDGKVRFLNAYPKAPNGQRTLPTPLSWRIKKGDEKPIYDFAVKETRADQKWKQVAEPFCCFESGQLGGLYDPRFQLDIHIARADRQQVTAGESTVFRYQSLAAGQVFSGVILADESTDMDEIAKLLPNQIILSLGKSHQAGYGRVRIENIPEKKAGDENELPPWEEYKPASQNQDAITVTLLSDALVRDKHSGACVASLEPIVGMKYQKAFIQTRVVGGFNRTWNLPLSQAQAIQAGSVFVYAFDSKLYDTLKALEEKGVGERRAEGLGRIAINWHGVGKEPYLSEKQPQGKQQSEKELDSPEEKPIELHRDSIALANRMVERMARADLDRRLIQAINERSIEPAPQNAQLSRLRIMARRALSQNNIEVISDHLKRMRKPARDQFQSARILTKADDKQTTSTPLTEWLQGDWLAQEDDPQSIWKVLDAQSDALPSLGSVKPELSRDLALEYTVRLIDGVLRKTLREKR